MKNPSHACAIKDSICVTLCLFVCLWFAFLQGWSCCHTLEVCLLIKSVTLACCWPLWDSQHMPFSSGWQRDISCLTGQRLFIGTELIITYAHLSSSLFSVQYCPGNLQLWSSCWERKKWKWKIRGYHLSRSHMIVNKEIATGPIIWEKHYSWETKHHQSEVMLILSFGGNKTTWLVMSG